MKRFTHCFVASFISPLVRGRQLKCLRVNVWNDPGISFVCSWLEIPKRPHETAAALFLRSRSQGLDESKERVVSSWRSLLATHAPTHAVSTKSPKIEKWLFWCRKSKLCFWSVYPQVFSVFQPALPGASDEGNKLCQLQWYIFFLFLHLCLLSAGSKESASALLTGEEQQLGFGLASQSNTV